MEKKLYRVKVILYVMGENQSEARLAATQARFDIFECAASRAETVDPEWMDAIPFNADDERTCAQILAERPHVAGLESLPGELPAYMEAGIQTFENANRSLQPGTQS